MRTHEDQGHCIVAISVSLEENTSTLMAELTLFRLVATQRGIVNDVVLNEIQDGPGRHSESRTPPGFCLEGHFENARLPALLREITLVTAINETDTVNAVSLLNGLHDVIAIRMKTRPKGNYHSLQKCIFTAVFADDLGFISLGQLRT